MGKAGNVYRVETVLMSFSVEYTQKTGIVGSVSDAADQNVTKPRMKELKYRRRADDNHVKQINAQCESHGW